MWSVDCANQAHESFVNTQQKSMICCMLGTDTHISLILIKYDQIHTFLYVETPHVSAVNTN